jgi:PPOX class probable F420-dependent enzyme
MTAIPDAVRHLIASDALGHLVTLNHDGSPQVSCVWIGFEADEIVIGTLRRTQKVRNIARDPRVTLSVEAGTRNAMGLIEYLLVHGRARVVEGGAPELLQTLARTYIAPDAVFPPMPNPPPGYVIRILPERVGGVGPWTRG